MLAVLSSQKMKMLMQGKYSVKLRNNDKWFGGKQRGKKQKVKIK